MKKILIVTLLILLTFSFVACKGESIGKISRAENEYITINEIQYVMDNTTSLSNADKGKYLGKVSNSNITMRVYSVKGDNEDYIYALWDWEGAFYKKEQ